MPRVQYVRRSCEVRSAPEFDIRSLDSGGIATKISVPMTITDAKARALRLLRASMKSITAAPPTKAPREEDATIPTIAVPAIPRSAKNFHLDRCGLSPMVR